ncbi:platelet binding protein GspB-like isoform X1 [Neodiprion lecontei]|uniref:Platelet binding protein GspB-like isoform X1 n=1 Tax=Neodiprion lecontei TaxID=441921 RepID=A0A6J0CBL4_NEOLC|nr:platelet binding protein GspB-like isoform X1 [Neodiprion lecontei]
MSHRSESFSVAVRYRFSYHLTAKSHAEAGLRVVGKQFRTEWCNDWLSARRTSSMNDQPAHGKNYSQKSRENDTIALLNPDSDSKRRPADDYAEEENQDQVRPATPSVATFDLAANLTSLNGSVTLVSNAGKSGSPHDQSHSKRHSRRSKLYRREGKVKSRGSLAKKNAASPSLIPFGMERSDSLDQDPPRGRKRNSGLAKLLDSTSKTSNATSEPNPVAASRNDSIPSNFLSTGESKVLLDRLSDESSKLAKGSGSTENWLNFSSSSSSSAGSTINETASSIELMTFGFESAEEFRRSALINSSHVAPSSIAAIHSSFTTARLATLVSDRSADMSESTSARPSTVEMINRSQSMQRTAKRRDVDDNSFEFSVHSEDSRDVPLNIKELFTSARTPGDNTTKDHSVILTSIGSDSSSLENSYNTSLRISAVRNGSDTDTIAESTKNSSHDEPEFNVYSRSSVNDSLNRLTLLKVADTLKHIDCQKARRSYTHSNSTFSEISDDASPKLQIESVKVLRSSSKGKLHSLKLNDSEFEVAEDSSASPGRMSIDDKDGPLKLTMPLSIDTMAKAGTSGKSAEETVEVPRQSKKLATTFGDPSLTETVSKKRNVDHGPLREVLDVDQHLASRCNPGSSTERSENVQRVDSENRVDQQRTDAVTLSVSESSISNLEHCLMRSSSSAMPRDFINDPERRLEALVASIIPDNPEEREADATFTMNRNHDEDTQAGRLGYSSPEPRGPQSLHNSDVIVLETFEPVVSELVTPLEEVADVDGSPGFTGLEEHCNSSLFNVFIPSVNSREIVARSIQNLPNSLVLKINEPMVRIEMQNITTEDSLYIMEGFGLFKNSPEDVSELEEELDRRKGAPFDYAETEGYLVYSPPGDHAPGLKVIDEIEFKAELPAKPESLVADVLWNRNFGEEMDDLSWLDDETGNAIWKSIQSKDAQQKSLLNPSEYPATLSDVKEVQSPVKSLLIREHITEKSTHHLYILPTIYVLIGMCVVIVGCSIWYSKKRVKRRSNLPKLKYFVQQRQETTEAIV